ncbi:NfeD family protein [Pararcticibacter amylolyticus]|uniref:Serine protease n=1 Tax=Pararcticibacter amylolyticus TaxID=2173175 RepID=A0A2U2PKD5_9SPHI|nr:NfeD family protein [Pararcticibacter amylolyticus]PWG81788.1 serine protease [Pararcticibacter amylolyticus]
MLFITLLFSSWAFGQGGSKVYLFDMKEEIGPSAWRLTRKAFQKADEAKASVVLIRMNTFGGMVDYADSIRTRILNAQQTTIVYIDNNAASAGALIALACDRIYMKKGAGIGAASVVNPKGEIMPEKYQSYMRGLMRATAEAKGRDPRIAEAFVDPDVAIPGINEKGKVLTLTSREAVKAGFCEAEVSDLNEVLNAERIDSSLVVTHHVSFIDRIIAFLINPAVSGILILLIIGGIYFEMQSPGIGFALLVAVVAALLFFAPLYLEGLAAHWEIGLFLVGVILLLLEIFVIPGFGVAGIMGIICIIGGLVLSLVLNDWFDFTVTGSEQISSAAMLVMGSMVLAIVVCVFVGKSLLKTPVFQRLVLQDEQRSQMGYVSGRQRDEMLNKTGYAKTDMRPSGKIEIEGKWYDAVSLDGYIDKGTEVVVEKQENYNVFVRKKNS